MEFGEEALAPLARNVAKGSQSQNLDLLARPDAREKGKESANQPQQRCQGPGVSLHGKEEQEQSGVATNERAVVVKQRGDSIRRGRGGVRIHHSGRVSAASLFGRGRSVPERHAS